ncbi:MAG TPA: hypothetical protein VJ506_07550 [Candidatus Limnocylindrales bacterium]|nr:hypothetical protein [Candidatus Limnocylindrales bacterium]
MVATRSWRTRAVGALASMIMLVGLAGPAAAADPAVYDFPAGVACQFELQLTVYGGAPQVNKDFGDGIFLTAGKGSAITYTNVGTGDSISTKAGGAVNWTSINPDGSAGITLTGSNVVILFPTDVDGPSVAVYTGRVVIDVAADGAWTVRTSPPMALDVCAALS